MSLTETTSFAELKDACSATGLMPELDSSPNPEWTSQLCQRPGIDLETGRTEKRGREECVC